MGHPEFESTTGFLLARLGSMAARSWQGMLRAQGLTPHEHAVLLTLRSQPGLGQQALARQVAVDPRNLVPVIDSLEAKRLLQRSVDPADRRRRRLDLTATGRAGAERLADAAGAIEEEFLRGLDTTEQRTLNSLLRTLRESLAESRPEDDG